MNLAVPPPLGWPCLAFSWLPCGWAIPSWTPSWPGRQSRGRFWEYWQLWRGAGLRLDPILLYGLAAVWLFRYAYPNLPQAGVVLVIAVVAGLAYSLRFEPHAQPFMRWALTRGGAAWLGFCPGFLLLLYHGIASRPRAVEVVLLTVGISVIGDTLAYLVGSRFGRHPFFARISPRKTWEGALAAIIVPTVAVGLLLPLALPKVGHPWAFAIGFLAALAAVAGDLVESQLKRELGVKDSGPTVTRAWRCARSDGQSDLRGGGRILALGGDTRALTSPTPGRPIREGHSWDHIGGSIRCQRG